MNAAFVKIIFLAHVVSTFVMVGVIWYAQIVHYPLLAHVGKKEFLAYQSIHLDLIVWVVVPPMLVEIVTGLLLLWNRPEGVDTLLLWLGLFLIAVIWLSTLLVLRPQHHRLAKGFDSGVHRGLLIWNWVRTFGWSARGVLVGVMLATALR